jgi:predicted N-acetyltransferase YhbS
MQTKRRDYRESDFALIRNFLSESHRGHDVAWNWCIDRWNFSYALSAAMSGIHLNLRRRRIGLWEDGSGIVALALTEGELRGEAFIQSRLQELPEALLEEVLDFIEERYPDADDAEGGDAEAGDATNGAPGDRVIRLRLDSRFPTRRVLAERRGFRRLARTESSAWLDLAAAPRASIPERYTLSDARSVSASEDAGVHSRAFGYVADTALQQRAEEGFERLRKLADYRAELKLYLRSEDGSIASFVGLWYDEANRWGIVEPAGTVGEHRRRGLGTALLAEGARRIAELGGRGIWVGSDQAFYLACGFRIVNTQEIWEKRYPALSESAEPSLTSRS